MSRPEQKAQERKDFELFRSLSSFHFDEINLDCEKPDCDVQSEGKKIGIEITEFVRSKKQGNKLRSVNDTLFKIKEEIKSEIRKVTSKYLTINYSLQTLLTRKISSVDKRKIVIFLVDHISKKEVLQKLHEDSFYFEFEYLESENEFIESVRVSTYPGKNTLTVSENKSYLTGIIPQKYLELIINEKETKMDFLRNMET